MSALQKKYFGGGQRRNVGVGQMARRRRSYSRARSFVGRSYRRGRSIGGGKFGGMIPPVLGGAADTFLGGFNLPIVGKVPTGVGSALVGHFMGSQTTRDIGLYQIGASLPRMFGVGGQGTSLGIIGQV
jgi:hypothetical protein